MSLPRNLAKEAESYLRAREVPFEAPLSLADAHLLMAALDIVAELARQSRSTHDREIECTEDVRKAQNELDRLEALRISLRNERERCAESHVQAKENVTAVLALLRGRGSAPKKEERVWISPEPFFTDSPPNLHNLRTSFLEARLRLVTDYATKVWLDLSHTGTEWHPYREFALYDDLADLPHLPPITTNWKKVYWRVRL